MRRPSDTSGLLRSVFLVLFYACAFFCALGLVTPSFAGDEGDNDSPWQPKSLTLQLPVGTGKTSEVTFTPERRMEHVRVHILSPSGSVMVEPRRWEVLERGVPVNLTVLVSTPSDAKPGGSFTAEISIIRDKTDDQESKDRQESASQTSPFSAEPEHSDRHRESRLPISVHFTNNPNSFSHVTLYENPTSPMMMGYESNSGYFINLFGERDSHGNALSFDGVSAANSTSSQSITRLDSNKRPAEMMLSGGLVLEFSWTSDTQAQVEVISPNGSLITSLAINATSAPAAAASIVQTTKAFNASHPAAARSLAQINA